MKKISTMQTISNEILKELKTTYPLTIYNS